jgi:hypothetical protein
VSYLIRLPRHKIQCATSRNLDMYRNSVTVIQVAVFYSNPVSALLKQLRADFLHSSSLLITLDTIVMSNETTSDILFRIISTFRITQVRQQTKSNNSIRLGWITKWWMEFFRIGIGTFKLLNILWQVILGKFLCRMNAQKFGKLLCSFALVGNLIKD